MCFGSMPAMPAMPEVPKVIDQTQVKQNAVASNVISRTKQAAMAGSGQGTMLSRAGGDQGTMLTEMGGVDPTALQLGKKTLLGG